MHFSVIIPAKNEESNIGRCLDSLRKLDYDGSRYEVIVVDNGSSDRTVEIARQKGALVFVQPDMTISGLRNFGAAQARGEILAFLDADCTVLENWLNEAACYLLRKEVACFGSPPIVPENATWVQNAWFLIRKRENPVQAADWLESMNMFVRREIFAEIYCFDESLVTCEDYDLSLRLKTKGLLLNDNGIVAIHHGEAATVATFFRKEKWRGLSNYRGLMRHGFVWKEIPSIVAPPVHCLLALAVGMTPLIKYPGLGNVIIFLFVVWQSVLFFLSVRKNRAQVDIVKIMQLYLLLNVYFSARGLAVFGGRNR